MTDTGQPRAKPAEKRQEPATVTQEEEEEDTGVHTTAIQPRVKNRKGVMTPHDKTQRRALTHIPL